MMPGRRRDAIDGPDRTIEIERPGPGSHRTTIVLDGRPVETLADLPPLRNRLLFVGLHPTPLSVEAGHYHQGPAGQAFWLRLVAARILPAGAPVTEADDALLAEGHGITDLSKAPVADGPPDEADLRAGVGRLWQKIALWRPAAIVFLDARAASTAAGRRLDEAWGVLPGVALAGRPCFLMPRPQAPRDELDEALNFLRNLAAALPR